MSNRDGDNEMNQDELLAALIESDNAWRRLGEEYKASPRTPADMRRLRSAGEKWEKERKPLTARYRQLRQDGLIPAP